MGQRKSLSMRGYAAHRKERGLSGASESTVRHAVRTGRISKSLTRDKRRIRDAGEADAEWAASTKAEMAPLTGPTAPDSSSQAAETPPVNELAAARARREAANAELAEIELAAKRGSLLEARHVEARLADVFLRCRTRILGVPARLREQAPTVDAETLQLVESLLFEALEELAG